MTNGVEKPGDRGPKTYQAARKPPNNNVLGCPSRFRGKAIAREGCIQRCYYWDAHVWCTDDLIPRPHTLIDRPTACTPAYLARFPLRGKKHRDLCEVKTTSHHAPMTCCEWVTSIRGTQIVLRCLEVPCPVLLGTCEKIVCSKCPKQQRQEEVATLSWPPGDARF